MARHAKTREFTAEFYRVVTTPSTETDRQLRHARAMDTVAHANSCADAPLTTTYSRELAAIDEGNIIVLDVLILKDNEQGADPTTLASVDVHSIQPGSRLRTPMLSMPHMTPNVSNIARQVTYTQPQVVRFIRKTGSTPYSGGTVPISGLIRRAVNVHPATPEVTTGYRVVAHDSSFWNDQLFSPGTDLNFDMAWGGNTGIASACTLTLEV